jgi:hypothetical protein
MFIKKSMSLYTVSSFSWRNFLTRCANQLLVVLITMLFIKTKSLYTCIAFLLIILFNILNFKITFDKEPFLKYVLKNQIDFKLNCYNKEKVFFKAFFALSILFLVFKLSNMIITPLEYFLPASYNASLLEYSKIHERLSYLLWETPELYTTDLICHLMLTFTTFVSYMINRKATSYHDFYTVKVYRKVFTDLTKNCTLICALALLLLIEIVFFKLNLLGFVENVIILVLMIKIFFKIKISEYQNMTRYINVLKYLSIVKLILFVTIISVAQIIGAEPNDVYIKFLTSELESFLHPQSSRLIILILLYYLYNIISFCMKFQKLFCMKEPSEFLNILQNKPYKLFFISYFAKNLLKILKVSNVEKVVRYNLELRYKFYDQLKVYAYFKKSFEYSFKSSNSNFGLSTKYSLYEIWTKYWNIFNVYKYDFIIILLNGLMSFFLASKFLSISILSVFYLILTLVIMMSVNFRVIWQASMAFCIAPTIMIIFVFFLIKFSIILEYEQLNIFLKDLMTH